MKNLLKLNRFVKLTMNNLNQALQIIIRIKVKLIYQNYLEFLLKKKEQKKKKNSKQISKNQNILKNYLTQNYKKIFKSFLSNKPYIFIFNIIVYKLIFIGLLFFMILEHMAGGSAISLVYAISVFCFALLEYPRPKKAYWIIIQLKVILIFINENTYKNLIINLYYCKIGFR